MPVGQEAWKNRMMCRVFGRKSKWTRIRIPSTAADTTVLSSAIIKTKAEGIDVLYAVTS